MKRRTLVLLLAFALLAAAAIVLTTKFYWATDSAPRAGSASPNEGHGVLQPPTR